MAKRFKFTRQVESSMMSPTGTRARGLSTVPPAARLGRSPAICASAEVAGRPRPAAAMAAEAAPACWMNWRREMGFIVLSSACSAGIALLQPLRSRQIHAVWLQVCKVGIPRPGIESAPAELRVFWLHHYKFGRQARILG